MANNRELRRRIKSVQNTAQITKAMELVSATKMRRAQNQALAGRPYMTDLIAALANLVSKVETKDHPFFIQANTDRTEVILLSTDKPLAGSLNTNLFRAVLNLLADQKNPHFYTVGKKGRIFVNKLGKTVEADFENKEIVNFSLARQVSKVVTDSFLNGTSSQVYLVYPHFVSTLRQEPKVIKLLPINTAEINDSRFKIKEGMGGAESKGGSEEGSQSSRSEARMINAYALMGNRTDRTLLSNLQEFILEPSAEVLLNELLTHYIQVRIYQSMLETKASEHSARMIAMKNATDNAKELVTELKLFYNQSRQNAITSELLEITSGAAALQ